MGVWVQDCQGCKDKKNLYGLIFFLTAYSIYCIYLYRNIHENKSITSVLFGDYIKVAKQGQHSLGWKQPNLGFRRFKIMANTYKILGEYTVGDTLFIKNKSFLCKDSNYPILHHVI